MQRVLRAPWLIVPRRRRSGRWCSRSFHRHRLRQIARLVDIGPLSDRDMIGQALYRQRIDERRDQRVDLVHLDRHHAASTGFGETLGVADQDALADATHAIGRAWGRERGGTYG